MSSLTLIGVLFVVGLFTIKRRLHRQAYHRPHETSLNTLSLFVDRVVWAIVCWVIVAMLFQYGDSHSLQPSAAQFQSIERAKAWGRKH